MDSMRSLNTSLPSSYTNRPAPPEQLLQAFRTAALSVTNLYKSAVTDQSHSRQEGYQDALDDLLVFLDKENLGLQDGEGWRVRQWITERYDRASAAQQHNDSEDEPAEVERRPRSISPTISKTNEESPSAEEHQPEVTVVSEEATATTINLVERIDQPTMFRFTANSSNQQDTSMQVENSSSPSQDDTSPATNSAVTPVRVGVLHRPSRTPIRHASPRHGTRASTREVTLGAGTKRKLQFPDFFDISNVGSSWESGGGGKRGRFA